MQIANSLMKMCSKSLIIWETQIKNTMRFQFTPIRMAITKRTRNNRCGEDVEKKEPWNTVGRNRNLYSYYGKQYVGSLKNSK